MRFSACPGQYIQPGPPFNDYNVTLDHMSMNETSTFLNFQRALDLESQTVCCCNAADDSGNCCNCDQHRNYGDFLLTVNNYFLALRDNTAACIYEDLVVITEYHCWMYQSCCGCQRRWCSHSICCCRLMSYCMSWNASGAWDVLLHY